MCQFIRITDVICFCRYYDFDEAPHNVLLHKLKNTELCVVYTKKDKEWSSQEEWNGQGM
jgi:hypothetical protein